MPPALWTLLWLNFRATFRKTGRQLRTVRGVLFFLIGISMLGAWLGPSIFMNSRAPRVNSQHTLQTAPAALLLLCLLNLLTSAGERAVSFTPAEIDFLFPGPFSRKQLLAYKLIKTGISTLFSAVIFGIVVGRFGGTFFCRMVGVWLLFQFFQLLAMIIALVQTIIGERAMASSKRWVLLLLAVAVGVALLPMLREHRPFSIQMVADFGQTPIGQVVLAPFTVFAHALMAKAFLFGGLQWAAGALAMDLLMVVIVISLDANYLETSAMVSARRYERLARVRQSGLAGMARANSSRLKIGMLPWLAGTGPLVWRQLTTAIRTSRNLLIILLIAAVAGGVAVSKDSSDRSSLGMIVGMSVYLNLFLSQLLKFDFRGDLDRLDLLKSLPLRPTAVSAAQLVTPVLILSVVQLLLLTTIAVVGSLPPFVLLVIAALVIPINCLVLGVDNLMFLLFPFRPKPAVAGDMTMMGRQTIVFLCRFITILITAGVAAGLGFACWIITRSLPATALATWLPLVGMIVLIVWLTGVVYERFDPSVSTPT
jgi:hypothetical protein